MIAGKLTPEIVSLASDISFCHVRIGAQNAPSKALYSQSKSFVLIPFVRSASTFPFLCLLTAAIALLKTAAACSTENWLSQTRFKKLTMAYRLQRSSNAPCCSGNFAVTLNHSKNQRPTKRPQISPGPFSFHPNLSGRGLCPSRTVWAAAQTCVPAVGRAGSIPACRRIRSSSCSR